MSHNPRRKKPSQPNDGKWSNIPAKMKNLFEGYKKNSSDTEKAIEELTKILHEINANNDSLDQQIRDSETEFEENQKLYDSLQMENQEMQTIVKATADTHKAHREQLAEMRKELEEFENESLGVEFEKFESKFKANEDELTNSFKSIEGVNAELKEKIMKHKSTREALIAKEIDETRELNEKIEVSTTNCANLRAQIDEKQASISQQLAKEQGLIRERDKMVSEDNELQDKVANDLKEVRFLEEKLNGIQKITSGKQQRIDEMKQKLLDQKNNTEILLDENITFTNEINNMKTTIDILNEFNFDSWKDLNDTIVKQNSENQSKELNINELEISIAKNVQLDEAQKRQLNLLQEHIKNLEIPTVNIPQAEAKLAELKAELAQPEGNDLEVFEQGLRDELVQLQCQLDAIETTRQQEVKTRAAEAQKAKEKLATLKNTFKEKKEDLSNLSHECKQLKLKLNEMTSKKVPENPRGDDSLLVNTSPVENATPNS